MSGKRLRPEADDAKLKPPGAKKTRTKEDVQETIKGIVEKIEQVGRENGDVSGHLKQLKGTLANAAAVDYIVKNENVSMLIEILAAQVASIGKNEYNDETLQLVSSCLANCCNFSIAICLEIKRLQHRIAPMIVRILESSSTSLPAKTSVTRLVANVVVHKESALLASGSSSLLDLICQFLDSEHFNLAYQSLRAIRGLVNASFTKTCLLSNVGFYLGKLLKRRVKEENDVDSEVWKILDRLSRRFARDTGRQLASSDCTEVLLEAFFTECKTDEDLPEASWQARIEDSICIQQRVLITLANASHDLREKLGENNIIDKIVELDSESTSVNITANCRLLSSMTQDAWGRAAMRERGGLEYLVRRLSESSLSEERLIIIDSLRHFVHDTLGMTKMAHIKLFIDTVIRNVNKYLEDNSSICQPRVVIPSLKTSMATARFSIGDNVEQMKDDEEVVERLHKDFHSMWNYNTTSPIRSSHPSPTYSMTSSPMYSRDSSFSSPNRMHSSPRSSVSHNSEIFDVLNAAAESDDASNSRPERRDIENDRRIVDGELWLLICHAQDDQNMLQLLREDLIASVLSYLCKARRPDHRAYRILRRMAASRAALESLLSMQFHIRVLDALCSSPCRMTKFGSYCERCERNAELGREILREFAAHVDSDFGHAFLVRKLDSKDFVERLTAAIAKVALIRDQCRSALRLSQGHTTAMDVLFDSLDALLSSGEMQTYRGMKTYEDGPPLCAQIIGSLSTLFSVQRIREMFDAESFCLYTPLCVDEGKCAIVEAIEKNEENRYFFKTISKKNQHRFSVNW
ncbi:hypothetical protein WR25_03582 isoform D [Diploscapter pachys]|uniref:Uncharacterized protein n=1 Tax=Diploscapter pachys TaxID=2018661 RepID=A0A2A2LGF5_9BILA|nr:hypothetical protein WR25_03582 isoform B [Diploscapter pachys]PAV85285.1 hypothetical protein WR25_03582 isoform D [Diploscapter pachys]